ncbi:MAG: superoxide dismutase family protein [Clostridia bacterium]|nr:superoxide dismutase family protein [Clostridia bacterium]
MQKNVHWLSPVLRQNPHAVAHVRGSDDYPEIQGIVQFYQTRRGVLVTADFTGLPEPEESCASPIFGFHIHEGARCSGTAEAPFDDAGSHWNPDDCLHPYHAGDLPPLFGNHGRAFLAVLTDRFHAGDLPGKTVILHGSPDDFTTQPAGNAGIRIACGEIRWNR